jgi:putative FmdB family regulatory protein
MPSYDYRCTQCRTQFQARHRMSAAGPPCPICASAAERIILAAPVVHGYMARGREAAVRTYEHQETGRLHGPGCPCCHSG